jgi:hypothetical protein
MVMTKINDSVPMHRSQTSAFGAKVPNLLQRRQGRPFLGFFWVTRLA